MHGLSGTKKRDAGRKVRVAGVAAICAASLLVVGCRDRKLQNGNPIQQGQAQQVHLIWKQGTSEWKVKLNNGPEVSPASARSTLNAGTGPTMFVVDIAGHPTASFKDPGGLDVWPGDNAKSQPQQGINSTQILGPIVTKGGKLVFFDLNYGDKVTLNYRLNFNGSVPSVDPIVDNGGGTWSE